MEPDVFVELEDGMKVNEYETNQTLKAIMYKAVLLDN